MFFFSLQCVVPVMRSGLSRFHSLNPLRFDGFSRRLAVMARLAQWLQVSVVVRSAQVLRSYVIDRDGGRCDPFSATKATCRFTLQDGGALAIPVWTIAARCSALACRRRPALAGWLAIDLECRRALRHRENLEPWRREECVTQF